MASLHHLAIVGRIFGGLLAGRDGEEVIASVRDRAVPDKSPLLKKVAVVAFLAIVALGCFEVAGSAHAPQIADFAVRRTAEHL